MSVYVDGDLCKSCKLCMDICPKNVFEMSHKVNKKGYNYAGPAHEEACIHCSMCEKACPDFAIHVEK